MSGLLTYASNEDLQKQQTELEDAEEAQENEDLQQYLNTLEGYLASEFEDARMWKEGESDIQDTIIDSLNRRNGKYSSEKLSTLFEQVNSLITWKNGINKILWIVFTAIIGLVIKVLWNV